MAKLVQYLYEIKNKLNNKIYIGIHSTEDIDDGYMGSGTLIVQSISKYGKNNFIKTILEYCDNRELLIELEKKIVNKEFVNRRDTYNLVVGGSSINSTWKKSNETIAYKLKTDSVWSETRSRNISLGIIKAMENGKCSTATRDFQLIRNKKSLTEESIKNAKKLMQKINTNKEKITHYMEERQYIMTWVGNGFLKKKLKNT